FITVMAAAVELCPHALRDALPISFIDLPVRSNALKREYRECERFNDAVVERLARIRPDLTVVALNQWVLPQDPDAGKVGTVGARSEEHTSELQSRENLVCRLLLEK